MMHIWIAANVLIGIVSAPVAVYRLISRKEIA